MVYFIFYFLYQRDEKEIIYLFGCVLLVYKKNIRMIQIVNVPSEQEMKKEKYWQREKM